MTSPTSESVAPNVKADIAEIKRALSIFFSPGDTIELRALKVSGKNTHAGYFRDLERLATEAAKLSGHAQGVYVVLNTINPALFARAASRIVIGPETLTQDKDVLRRRWLPIDVDAKRPAGISSSEDEHRHAIETAYAIREHLAGFGFLLSDIILGDSGNGGHVLAKIDLANDAASEIKVKACIAAVALKFNSETISIDQTVYNAARIWKLPGTMARKGDNIPERPHRLARLLEVPR
jgi:hypothetical protein